MMQCTVVVVEMKTGYKFPRHVKAGSLNQVYRYKTHTIDKTLHVHRFKKFERIVTAK
jgi:hypothetical protein